MLSSINEVISDLNIDGECIRAETHRHLAFFDIKVSRKANAIRKLERCAKDIAIHLRTKTIPIMRVIPAEGVVRLQVAMKDAEQVNLFNLYRGEPIPMHMVFPMLLGEDDTGKKLWMDMNHNPHLLVAGGTGSGKSTLLHNIIANALYIHALRARNIWVYLGDPKMVEFNEYTNPNLRNVIRQVASSYKDVVKMMQSLLEMVESRYQMMGEWGMRSVEENPTKMPLALCVIDEMADLMMQDKKSKVLQDLIVKIAQKGRAAGVFLVLATQRPSVDILTGLIKANFPGRVACKTASRKDSEVVLDRPGAETLLGRGDAVLQNMHYDSVRFQVAYTKPSDTIFHFNWLVNWNNSP